MHHFIAEAAQCETECQNCSITSVKQHSLTVNNIFNGSKEVSYEMNVKFSLGLKKNEQSRLLVETKPRPSHNRIL